MAVVDGWSFHAAGIGAVLLPALRPASMKRTKAVRFSSPPPSNNATTRACPFLTRLIEKRKETYNLMDVPFSNTAGNFLATTSIKSPEKGQEKSME
jgi:hypothetical protein